MNDAHLSSRLTRCHAWAWSALAIGLSLSAPTHTWAHEGSLQTFNEGWRQAKVISLIDNAEPAASTHIHRDCRNQASAEASTAEGVRHVLASYSFGGNPNLRRHIVVPVQAANTIKVGDAVHAHISDCQAKAH
ncbi:MAG: hypothetical protein RJB60_1607 [Pseudomonadota bacterium]|jgi:hypothetical protein